MLVDAVLHLDTRLSAQSGEHAGTDVPCDQLGDNSSVAGSASDR